MNRSNRILSLGVALWMAAVWLAAAASPAYACAVCYGEPDSPATRGLTWAIVLLAMVVVAVLAGIVSFFVAANRQAAATGNSLPNEGR